MEFSSLSALANYVQTQINDALKNDIAEEIIEVAKSTADEVVYGVYEPKDYDREFTYGSRGGGAGYDIIASDGEVTIKPAPIALADLIEYGDDGSTLGMNYTWTPPNDREPTYLYPRPFIATTKERIGDGQVVDALKVALEDRGIPVE